MENFDVEIYSEKSTVSKKNKIKEYENNSKNYYDNEEIQYFSQTEYQQLISNADKYYRLVYLLFFETGARVEEGRDIIYRDIDLDTNKIKVKTLKQRGKNKFRLLPISDTLKAAILQHQVELSLENDDFVLAKKSGQKPVIRQTIDNRMKTDCEKLGILRNKAHPHTLRHTRAIQLLENGVDIVKVQKFLGHSSIQNTLIYLKYSNKDFEKSIIEANKNIGLI